MDKKIRLSGIAYESLVNGPGIRRVFFSQGCNHNCKGCFNPDTHDFNGGEERNIDELIEDVLCNPMIKGITFSGGDPFERADEFSYMAKIFKENNKNIWCYTGYTFEYINDNLERNKGWRDLINNLDVLVDGKFEEDKKEDGLKFKGSSNQRIIDVKESLKSNKVVIFDI
ncbi:anaerobic ribonucleoside-triphosphate reductase activating protein [Clostridium botulinum]|uniref:Anaerobic ribonucleoside-triphosphate reductase-activating protein n=1 Tax=Clostridium botulinum TaxID=1491 RepID=A0A0L9YBT4_CLOBO|nr:MULTISPECIES: anaerobic ribonucleoside-triphosphate reductase activating protein [Clostridium]KAI3349623.1 anaerobic ribonucleoside-triphosphate reductase activating protein [Clostridium botulinum]KOM89302.1 ribonucleoside-triphosphate reductase activating protein [Clostridium botulinum]KOR58227.1 ribonucleoside-triphosphate reductase activating protein [Clostridium botulinum]MBN1040583.1 anaerobic ribonucleoside-triphosphate reductase activating protein [Clostridium botulinum]MBN1047235.1 